jgi:arginyl-tRNA--protein-N-Asp/Glu arginylyltransferase
MQRWTSPYTANYLNWGSGVAAAICIARNARCVRHVFLAEFPSTLFHPNRSQRRCWLRNQDLTVAVVSNINTDEHYNLYADYIIRRHSDGDMFPPFPVAV